MQVVPQNQSKEAMSSLSLKGQVTIPLQIRRLLGVQPRDKVIFQVVDGKVVVAPAHSHVDEHFQSVSALAKPRSLQEVFEIAQAEAAQEVAKEGL